MLENLNFSLLAISLLASTVSVYIAFSLIGQLYTASSHARKFLLPAISFAVGTATWVNHFILDLAYLQFAPVTGSSALLLIGLFFAVAMGYFIVSNASKKRIKAPNLVIDSIISSICALCLFYCGMSYLQPTYAISLDFYHATFGLFFVTGAIAAVIMSFFWVKTYNGKYIPIVKLLSAICIALGIAFAHFALHLSMADSIQLNVSNKQDIDLEWLGTILGISFAGLFLFVYIINVLLKKHGNKLFKLIKSPSKNTNSAEELLDALTELPNRQAFEVAIEKSVKQSAFSNKTFAVAFIDLDHFKPINDHYGHRVGDIVLQETAARLKTAVRACDYIARIGGDEFVAIIEQIDSEDDALPIANRMVELIKKAFYVDNVRIDISCSVGVARYKKDGDVPQLLACADAAMYKAKEEGKNQYKIYDAEIESASGQMLELHQDLRAAIKNREFKLLYLPKIDAKSNEMVGAEALIRWMHPTKGEIKPVDFLPAAEHFGLIYEINNWVLDECCSTIAKAKETGVNLNISINLSIQQFSNHQLVKDILKSISFYKLSPKNLSFEIKETLAISNQYQFQKLLTEFAAANINVILDDFGVQPISLPYLQTLKVNEVKIDRSFIQDIHKQESARSLVDALIKLAHALDFKVVAEGVENELQSDFLLLLGCDYIQGFLFTEPLVGEDLLNFHSNLSKKQLPMDFATKKNKKAIA